MSEKIINTPVKDYTRYLICPFTDKMFLIHTTSHDAQAYCPECKGVHGFQKRNKAMNGMELGKKNNAWVESW